jgi:hypothetical protein
MLVLKGSKTNQRPGFFISSVCTKAVLSVALKHQKPRIKLMSPYYWLVTIVVLVPVLTVAGGTAAAATDSNAATAVTNCWTVDSLSVLDAGTAVIIVSTLVRIVPRAGSTTPIIGSTIFKPSLIHPPT